MLDSIGTEEAAAKLGWAVVAVILMAAIFLIVLGCACLLVLACRNVFRSPRVSQDTMHQVLALMNDNDRYHAQYGLFNTVCRSLCARNKDLDYIVAWRALHEAYPGPRWRRDYYTTHLASGYSKGTPQHSTTLD